MKSLKGYDCDDCPGHSGASDRYVDEVLWLKWH